MDVVRNEVGDVRVNCDRGIEECDLAPGGFGFRERFERVGLIEEDLTLEVGGFDEVAVDEGEGADAGAGEQRRGCSSGGSAAYDGDVRTGEKVLPLGPNAGKEYLSRVSFGVGDGRAGGGLGAGWGIAGEGRWGLRHDGCSAQKTPLFRSIENVDALNAAVRGCG